MVRQQPSRELRLLEVEVWRDGSHLLGDADEQNEFDWDEHHSFGGEEDGWDEPKAISWRADVLVVCHPEDTFHSALSLALARLRAQITQLAQFRQGRFSTVHPSRISPPRWRFVIA